MFLRIDTINLPFEFVLLDYFFTFVHKKQQIIVKIHTGLKNNKS
jgi:hypothetical protein